jgi:hypothetical protein
MELDKEIKDITAQLEAAKIQVYHLEGALAMLQYMQEQKEVKDEIPPQEN